MDGALVNKIKFTLYFIINTIVCSLTINIPNKGDLKNNKAFVRESRLASIHLNSIKIGTP